MALLTLQEIQRASKLIIVLLLVSGCSLFSAKEDPKNLSWGPKSQVFPVSFDKAWEAAQQVASKYPMRINNIDVGLLETDVIKENKVWLPPHKKKKPGNGYQYTVSVRLVKGKLKGRPSTKITVHKKIQIKKDFFAKVQRVKSDGLEEKIILYRIGREIKMKRALNKLQSKSN